MFAARLKPASLCAAFSSAILVLACSIALAVAPDTAYAKGHIPWNEALGVNMDTFLDNAEAHRTRYYGTPYSMEERYGGPGVGMDCSSFWSFLIMNEGPVSQSTMERKTGVWGGYNTTVSIIQWVLDNDILFETGKGTDIWKGKIKLAKGDFIIETGDASYKDFDKLWYSASHVSFYWGLDFSWYTAGLRAWHSTNGSGNLVSGGFWGDENVFVVHGSGTPDPAIDKLPSFDLSRYAGQTALDTMQRVAYAGFGGSTKGTVILSSSDGYWDALTANGIAGLLDAPVLMTSPTKLSPQTKSVLEQLKPRKVIICGGTAAVSKSVESAVTKAVKNVSVVRYAGDTATGTANAIFQNMLKTDKKFSTAFVCTNNGYWDALAAAPISYAKGMPIFLTEGRNSISKATLNAMKQGGIKKVYIVGGTAAVSDKVATSIKNAGIEVVKRFGGATAIETSELVAEFGSSIGMSIERIGVATVNGYWDALTGAAFCGRNGEVLLLVDDKYSHSITGFMASHAKAIKGMSVFGGYSAISPLTDETAVRTILGV